MSTCVSGKVLLGTPDLSPMVKPLIDSLATETFDVMIAERSPILPVFALVCNCNLVLTKQLAFAFQRFLRMISSIEHIWIFSMTMYVNEL